MKASDRFFVGAGLVALPFAFSIYAPGEGMREPKARALVMLMGLFLALKLGEKFSAALGMGVALCYLSALFWVRIFPYQELLTLTLALLSCFLFVKPTKDHVKHFLEMLELGGLLCAAYAMILQLGEADPFLKLYDGADYRRVSVLFGQHTLYGPFCVAAFASSLLRRRYLMALLLVTPIIQINASFTFLSFGVVVAFFLVHKFGKVALFGLTALGIWAAISLFAIYNYTNLKSDSLNDNGRFALWRVTIAVANVRPFLGHGYSSFANTFSFFQSKELRLLNGVPEPTLEKAKIVVREAEELRLRSGWFYSAHSEPLQVFFEFGLLGVSIMLLAIASFVYAWLKGPMTDDWAALGAIFFSFLANSLGNFPFHLIPQALIPLWAFALVTGAAEKDIISLCRPSRIMSYFVSKKWPLTWLLSLVVRPTKD